MSEIEKCQACGNPYWINEVGGQMPGTRESEEICCPNCGYTFTRRSNGAFTTATLTPEALKTWEEQQASR